MSEVKLKTVHDFPDGESHIFVSADFTFWREATTKEQIKAAFEEVMMRFAI